MLPVELAQTVAGAVIVAEIELLVVSTTSSVAVPQPVLLLAVNRKVTDPTPEILTEVFALFWLTRLGEAEPVEFTIDHDGVPFIAIPLMLKATALPVWQSV